MKSFNVLDRNLDVAKSYLLEASAGTGKTFSIENIVCRLLLEGDQPLSLDQILVVTFTKAATSDLKLRIRTTIEDSLICLHSYETYDAVPDYLLGILEKGDDSKEKAMIHLRNALFAFDQAQIFTIHSFCSRMLSSYVLEGDISSSGMGDEPTFKTLETLKIIRNFFRTELTDKNFSPAQISIVLKKHKSSMENLEKSLIKWSLGGLKAILTPTFQESFLKFQEAMKSFSYEKDKILEDFNCQISNYRKLKNHETVDDKILRFASLFENETCTEQDFDHLIEDGLIFLEALDESQLKVKQKPIAKNEIHYPDLKENLRNKLLPIVKEAKGYENIFCRMVHLCQNMVEKYLKNEEKFRFDDLLTLMKNALKNDHFLEKIREQFKACIIDEFQDTDLSQWDIFRTLFQGFAHIYLVGDPKQSIYSFRQADIYTYLKAAESIPIGNRLSLDTNYRSSPSLTQLLNALFKKESCPEFIQLPKLKSSLEFVEVKSPQNSPDIRFSDDLGSLHFFIAEHEKSNLKLPLEEMEEAFYFPFMAGQILQLKAQDFSLSSMAILVKDHFQASRVLKYFKKQKIAISEQKLGTLSDSIVVQYLIELLLAVMNPKDESAIKTVLGNALIGYSHMDILALKSQEELEEIFSTFYQFKKILENDGYLKFMETFLKSQWKGISVAEKIISYEGPQELYDDLLQINDLVIEHQAKSKCKSDGLIKFLKELPLLNFDSDERIKKLKDPHLDAVKALTIHSSKGLEYDIVFALGLINRTPAPDIFIPVQNGDNIVLEPLDSTDSLNYLNYCNELDAEKSRQLYVAMTRAKYRLYVPAAFCSKPENIGQATASCMELFLSKIEYFKNRSLNRGTFKEWINTFPENLKITWSNLNEMNFSFEEQQDDACVNLEKPSKVNVENAPCFISSFTSLSKHVVAASLRKATPHDFDSDQKTIHNLPSGAKTGILLHEILEALPLEEYKAIKSPSELEGFISPFLAGTKFEAWGEVFRNLIFNVLNAQIGTFQFKDIDPTRFFREKEFIYSGYIQDGFIKGVIDLFFMHEGKYYFLDWKSNWLGNSFQDYEHDDLIASMKENDYYLQAKIYKEGIKRFLEVVDDRSFEECFGAVFYVYLRGIDLSVPGNGVLQI